MGSQELLWSLSCLLWSAHCQQTILQLARNSHQLTRQSVWAGDDPGGAFWGVRSRGVLEQGSQAKTQGAVRYPGG